MKSVAMVVCAPLTAVVVALVLDQWQHQIATPPVDGVKAAAPTGLQAMEPNPRLMAGVAAPDLALRTLSGEAAGRLSDLRGQPVVLIFGSFSCNLFDEEAPGLERLYQAYKDRVAFLMVNIEEAEHPLPCLAEAFSSYRQAASSPEVLAAWVDAAKHLLGVTFPIYTAVAPELTAYQPWPLRLVVIGADGRVARDAGLGIWRDWRVPQMSQELDRLLDGLDPGVGGEGTGVRRHRGQEPES
jgi:hypothetical protein